MPLTIVPNSRLIMIRQTPRPRRSRAGVAEFRSPARQFSARQSCDGAASRAAGRVIRPGGSVMTKIESCLVSMMLGTAAFLAGCAPDQSAPGQGQAEDVTEVEVALSTVPTGVQCVRVAATIGNGTTTVLRTVMAGASSASIDIGQLGTGNATFNGAAFNLACASVTGSTVANWIAVPVMTTLSLGVKNSVTMTFLP